jgi:hypothetical protein
MTKDEERVLAANEAFYAAFAANDVAAMETLWARQAPVACLHPGWSLLTGREDVLRSWRGILLGGGAPPGIRCAQPVAHVVESVAWVICAEVIPGALLAATNLFVLEAGSWRMAHHHASPLPQQQAAPPPTLPN